MRTNENKLTAKSVLFTGLGSFIGLLGIGTVKSLALGMSFVSGLVGSIPEALGRAACIAAVFGVYYLITKNNK